MRCIDAAGTAAVLGGAAVAVLFGIVLEGIVVGWAQARVLARRLQAMRQRTWICATAAGAGLAWTVGMVPSTLMALAGDASAPAAPTVEPPVWLQYGLAAVLGAVTGPLLGVAQWTVLRRRVAGAGRWLWANAAAWALGMPLIFVGMDLVPWGGSPLLVAVTIYAVCGVAGLVVGLVHGRTLVRLTSAV